MKLFQIEEPEGGPSDPNAAGAAIGIDASGEAFEVAMSVGGNAAILFDREGFEQILPVPAAGARTSLWREAFEGARLRAERALARPVTHAVVVLAAPADAATADGIGAAAERAGLSLLEVATAATLPPGAAPALAAAMRAEDLAPRPDSDRR